MFNGMTVARLSGFTLDAIRQMSHRGFMRPQGPIKRQRTWTKSQTLGLCAMRHARLAGASMSAAVGVAEILCRANWAALRAACDDGKCYLRIAGEHVELQTVSHKAAFDKRLIEHATKEQIPYVVVDVRHWLNRIDLAESEAIADAELRARGKQPA